MSNRLLTDEWLDGFEACQDGQSLWECPYEDNTQEAQRWQSGWHYCDFDDRVSEMETEYAS